MDDLHIDSRLLNFKTAIDDAVASVPDMTAEEKLRAVQWWNVASEKLQKIVNDSAADIHALADRYEEEDLNNKANDLVKTMESKIFEDVDSSLANKANLSAQTNEEPLDFPDIPTPNLADPELETSPATLTDSNVVAGQTLSMTNLTNSDINVPQTSPHLSSNIDSTHSNSQSLNETDANESLSLSENHEEVDGYQLADQLSIMENESLNFSTDDVTASISDLADISTENNVLYDIDQANRTNVIESAPKEQHSHQTLESSIQDSNSSLADNLGVESDHSFMSESGDSDLNIDRFDVSHVPLEIDTETNSLETLMANQTDANQSLISASIEKSIDPTTIPSIEDNTTKEDTDDKQYTCDVCGKISTNLSTHTSHKWTHTKSYVCDDCGAKFSTKGNLLVHQRRHTGEKPFACDKCPAIFSTKGNLRRHIKAHSGERSWACEICDSKFTEKKSLKVHMRRHTGERPYKCTVCNKAFSQTGVLQTHMALHLDERKYLCEMCGKAFRQRSQLRLHVLRHEGVKKWDCSNCAAKFLTKGDLERHFRIHTGERPYVCPLCGKTFTRQQSLNEHSNRHYGLKPYSCDICNKKFSEMSACYKHIKVHKKQQQKSEPDNPDLDNQVSHFPSLSSSNDDLVSSQPIIN